MNKSRPLFVLRRSAAGIVAASAMLAGAANTLWGAEGATNSPPSTATTPAVSSGQASASSTAKKPPTQAEKGKTDSTPQKVKLPPREFSGAEIYSMNCFRCHPERYPGERTAAQWKTVLLHMRVRANLTAKDANTVLKYLQDNSGY